MEALFCLLNNFLPLNSEFNLFWGSVTLFLVTKTKKYNKILTMVVSLLSFWDYYFARIMVAVNEAQLTKEREREEEFG